MNIIDLYTPMQNGKIPDLPGFPNFASAWEITPKNTKEWLESDTGKEKSQLARSYLEIAREVVGKVEALFKRTLPGHLVLMPSFGEFDGFARYNLGEHHVLLGIDFPDADLDYLKALTSHELSHVYRDHSPDVWSHLGKPLSKITRNEYLEAGSPMEHLVSEGLATLFSQHVYPEINPRIHHFYEPEEWDWCLRNDALIDQALRECLRQDQNVWSFYGEDRVKRGSPSRTHYYWAAKRIREQYQDDIISLHERKSQFFSAL